MNLDFKTYKSYNGYTVDETEFIGNTEFNIIKDFPMTCGDDDVTIAFGRIGDGRLWYYRSNWGRIWITDGFQDFGALEEGK